MTDTSKGYGTASYSGASSDTPGQRTVSPLAAELETKQRGLGDVIANGAKHRDDPSVFVGRANKPTPATAVGMKDPNNGGAPMGAVPGGVRPSSKRI
jgi:hypothetical protein